MQRITQDKFDERLEYRVNRVNIALDALKELSAQKGSYLTPGKISKVELTLTKKLAQVVTDMNREYTISTRKPFTLED